MLNKVLSVILFFIPHPFNVKLRRIFGQNIGEETKISAFSLIFAKELKIGTFVKVDPFCIVKANKVFLDDYSHIESLAIINGPSIRGADFMLGKHSRVFPFCWIEPGEGVYIGDHVGIGGHTLIFTHGSWANFFNGGPVQFGPVHIEDHTWLPWRVFIMPGVTIGKSSIIGANSTVTKSVPENSLFAGSPAKLIKENINQAPSDAEFEQRVKQVLDAYNRYITRIPENLDPILESELLIYRGAKPLAKNGHNIEIDATRLEYLYKNNSRDYSRFLSSLRRYGVRLSAGKK